MLFHATEATANACRHRRYRQLSCGRSKARADPGRRQHAGQKSRSKPFRMTRSLRSYRIYTFLEDRRHSRKVLLLSFQNRTSLRFPLVFGILRSPTKSTNGVGVRTAPPALNDMHARLIQAAYTLRHLRHRLATDQKKEQQEDKQSEFSHSLFFRHCEFGLLSAQLFTAGL